MKCLKGLAPLLLLVGGLGSPAAAEIMVAPHELNLGYRAAGETIEQTVWLINTGDEPVELAGAKGSCGCLSVELRPQTLQPHTALGVELLVTASKEPGKTKNVSVSFAVGGDKPLRLPVRVSTTGDASQTPADVVAETPLVDLGVVRAGTSIATTLKLLNTATSPRTVSVARAGCSCVSFPAFAPVTIGPGQATDVQVEIEAPSRITSETIRRVTLEVQGQKPVIVSVRLETRHPWAKAFRTYARELFSSSWRYDELRVEDDRVTALVWTRDGAIPQGQVICRFDEHGQIESVTFEGLLVKG